MRETAHLMGPDNSLFGIITHPECAENSRIAVIILNAGQVHHIGPNRIHVGLARELARVGFTTIRIDQSGKGESPFRSGFSRTEALLADFDDVAAEVAPLGIDRFVLLGLCSGADDALVMAQQRDRIAGLVLLDSYAQHDAMTYVNHVVRDVIGLKWIRKPPKNLAARLMRRIKHADLQVDVRDWEAADVMNGYYRQFLGRGGQIQAIFTHGARYYTESGQLGRSIGAENGLEEIYLKQASHTLCEPASRDRLYSLIVDWMTRQFGDEQHAEEPAVLVAAG